MTRTRLIFFPLLWSLLGCSMLPSARADDPLDALQARVIDVSQRVTPSVVHIEVAVKQNNRRKLVTGSGVLTDPNGLVLTNEHVVERAEKVSVVVPGRDGRYAAQIIGTDKQTDLAVLRISRREGEPAFPAATLGDSDALRVGEWVVAIGNPYGLEGTVSLGIVSAKGRDLRVAGLLNDFIQTDAMIDHGSSGGPLVNLKAEVVGINSRGQGRGIGFTIPISTARRIAADLLGEGRIARAYLGIALQPLNRELAAYWKLPQVHGVIVNGVAERSPAEAAGIAVGDIIVGFDGEKVRAEKEEDLGQFQRQVATSKIGRTVEIDLLRDGEIQQIEATLGNQPKIVPDEEESEFGFTVQEVTDHLYRQHQLAERTGVLVSFVERGSEAAEAGMRTADWIRSVEDKPIEDIEGFREAMRELAGKKAFLIKARRSEDLYFLLIVPRDKSELRAEGQTGD